MNIFRALNIFYRYVSMYLGHLCQSGEAFQPDSSLCITSSFFFFSMKLSMSEAFRRSCFFRLNCMEIGQGNSFLLHCLSVFQSVNFSQFHPFLLNHPANFNQTWHYKQNGWMDSSFVQMKDQTLFLREVTAN